MNNLKPFACAFCAWLNLIYCIVLVSGQQGSSWAPNMQLLEIIPSPDNTTEQIRDVPRPKNSEIVVGEDVSPHSRLVIKCNATFPVQIVYIGAGRPEFTTFTNVQWKEDPQMPLTFEAEASLGLLGFQGTLRSEDTGNYTCRSIQNATIHSYFYIYVPGPSLFTPPDDYNSEIYFTPRDKHVWIPCASSNSKAVVSLHKTNAGKLQCPEIGRNVAPYDPRKGFHLHLKDSSLKKPEGVYICVGSQKNENFRMMEYKLIPTNNNQSESGKHPCRPSPCGQKAECSVIDGHPICYCFRGLSGNPYSECGLNKDKCHSNSDCPARGQFCVQGKCTNDPCSPSPCGGGSTCASHGGRPRCACQLGYDGKPPYCLRKCQFHGDCSHNEICSRTHCQDPCPNRCGTNADCQVVQSGGYNKTALCTCPPGTTGDPEENCYDIGTDPGEQQQPSVHCPLGFVGPGPPNCRRKECSENYDCSPNHYCSADKRCLLHNSGVDSCGGICGQHAICQLLPRSSSSARPVCSCPSWATGDPFVRCFNLTTSPHPPPLPPHTRDPPCSGVCGQNAVCQLSPRSGSSARPVCSCPSWATGDPFVRCFNLTTSPNSPPLSPPHPPSRGPPCSGICGQNAVCQLSRSSDGSSTSRPVCLCPIWATGDPFVRCFNITGTTPPPQTQCLEDPDCPGGFECVGRLCIPEEEKPQCKRRCGLNAQCVGGLCTCPKNTVGDPHIACRSERTPCNPSPCANFAECREINGRAACRCILGYDGDAFTRCAPHNTAGDSDAGGRGSDSTPFKPGFVDEEYYVHSRFSGGTSRPIFPPQRSSPPSSSSPRDECDPLRPEDCGPPDYHCRRGRDGIARCVCSSFRCGYTPAIRPDLPPGVIYGRYCSINDDCRYPELCSNVTLNCYNPCDYEHSPCARVAFSECRVIDSNAVCTCRRGYVGNPANGLDCRRDFGTSSTELQQSNSGTNNVPIVHCDYEKGIGCDTKSECRLVEGRGQCICGPGQIGEYPDCRLRCRTNRDCFNAHECWKNECRDPCERNPCGSHAFCRVVDHKGICECKPHFSGDPWVACIPNKNETRKGFQLNCDGTKCSLF